MRLETIGLIINPEAGLGAEVNLSTAQQVLYLIQPAHVLAGPGALGQTAVSQPQLIPMPSLEGRAATQFLVRQMAAAAVDALVVIGGDGTMADVAFALHENGRSIPILGIGAGSTNAGDLITCRAGELGALAGKPFTIESVDALAAGCNGQNLALGFNDVVIGTTVLGTVAGNVTDLDATAFMAGESILRNPQPLDTETALVTKTSGAKSIEIARGTAVGIVIAGFAQHDCFFGKAIVGAVCLTALVDLPAGVIVCSQPLVRTYLSRANLAEVEPIHSAYASLDAADTITITGIGAPGVLCADGNPLKALQPHDQAQIQVLPNAVKVLRSREIT